MSATVEPVNDENEKEKIVTVISEGTVTDPIPELKPKTDDDNASVKTEATETNPPPTDPNEKNFPPAWCFFCCNPCFHQDISADIDSVVRPTVRCACFLLFRKSIAILLFFFRLFYFVKVIFVHYLIQLVSTTILWSATGLLERDGIPFFISLGKFIIFVPLNYVLWFRPAYNAFRNGSRCLFIFCFIFLNILAIGLLIEAAGIEGYSP